MKNITINRGNILKHNLQLSCKSATILTAINHIMQNKSFSPFDTVTDENGVWYAVSFNDIIKELPLLKSSKNTYRLHVGDLITFGFIDRHWNCERLSKTYLKPSVNFRLYFENDNDQIIINQDKCFSFDRKLTLLNWIVLQQIEKNAIRKFDYNFVLIDEEKLLKMLFPLLKAKNTYLKNLRELINMNYIEKTDKPKIDKVHFYRAGAKFLEFKELIK